MIKTALKGVLLLSLILNGIFLYMFMDGRDSQNESETSTTSDVVTAKNEPMVYESGKTYPLMRVIDGDTIVVGFSGQTQYVRLIGIDSPEPNDPGGPQCYADEATKHLQEIAQTGVVVLHFDETQGMHDSYGRLLAYVELPDGTDLGQKMIEEGYAHEYTYKADYERLEEYKNAETQALENELGLWSPDACQ